MRVCREQTNTFERSSANSGCALTKKRSVRMVIGHSSPALEECGRRQGPCCPINDLAEARAHGARGAEAEGASPASSEELRGQRRAPSSRSDTQRDFITPLACGGGFIRCHCVFSFFTYTGREPETTLRRSSSVSTSRTGNYNEKRRQHLFSDAPGIISHKARRRRGKPGKRTRRTVLV